MPPSSRRSGGPRDTLRNRSRVRSGLLAPTHESLASAWVPICESHFLDTKRPRGLRKRTPGPPPFSSMNCQHSMRLFRASPFAPPSLLSTDSWRATVGSDYPPIQARAQVRPVIQPSNARAAFDTEQEWWTNIFCSTRIIDRIFYVTIRTSCQFEIVLISRSSKELLALEMECHMAQHHRSFSRPPLLHRRL